MGRKIKVSDRGEKIQAGNNDKLKIKIKITIPGD